MLVESLMTRDAESARPESTLAEAAAVMWRRDCGVVPVTDEGGRVVGVITDRAVCAPHGSGEDEHTGGEEGEAAGEEHYEEAGSAQEVGEAGGRVDDASGGE